MTGQSGQTYLHCCEEQRKALAVPWWGWLIAAGIAAFCLTAIVVVAMTNRTMRMVSQAADDKHERWRKRHNFGDRPL
ncbi:MAG: hypothetical protein ACRDRO_23490 [Pseudonocardiaceae bacterium]